MITCRTTLAALVVIGAAGACADDEPAPAERAVIIETTACGDASRTTGSGVIVADDTVLTAAHVVVGAADVTAGGRPARIDVLDTERDLARLHVDGIEASSVAIASAAAGAEATIASSSERGTIAAVVARRLDITIEEVRSDRRVTRDGYELRTITGGGDSGAGVFDVDDRLIGVLFATSNDRDGVSYATASSELRHVLDEPAASHVCDAAESRVVPDG